MSLESAHFESSAEETIKLLFSGDEFSANVKNQNFSVINRTPVFCTTNNTCFPHNLAFSERIFYETWKPFNHLKTINKQLDPMCIFGVFKNYNLITDNLPEVNEQSSEL